MDLKELLEKRVARNNLILLDRKTKLAKYFFSALWLAVQRRISQLFIVKIPHLLGRPEFVRATAFFGLSMRVLRRDKFCMDNWGIIGGGTDILTIRFLINAVKKGATVIDGGAYIGWYTALTAELVGQTGSVHSFEPTPKSFLILKENLAGKNNVYLNKLALSNINGSVEFYDFGENFGYANTILSQEKLNSPSDNSVITQFVNRIKVEAVTLDDYCVRREIKPDFIKLDLEGGEYNALLGAKKVLKIRQPVLILEVSRLNIGDGSYGIMANFLQAYGYSAYRMSSDENFHIYFHPFKAENAFNFNLENLIFSVLSLS